MVAQQLKTRLVALQHGYAHTRSSWWAVRFYAAKEKALRAAAEEERLFARIRMQEAATEAHLQRRAG